jgi:D-tyrosyl-tRNA(Tyr) deacylase
LKALLQRVARAEVRVGSERVARIGRGLLVLLGVEQDDGAADADGLADKTAELRVFPDADGRMNRSLEDVQGSVLVVSQFTLVACTRRGRRPSFARAAPPPVARVLCERFSERLRAHQLDVACGIFGAMMEVELVNDGPVTLMLESPRSVLEPPP